MTLLLRCQGEITKKILKMIFLFFIPSMIIRALKVRNSRIHIPFNFLIITISIYVPTTKIKAKNSTHKLKSYRKVLTTRIWLESARDEPETLLDCCRKCKGTNHKCMAVWFVAQKLWSLSNSFRTQSWTQRFRWNSNRTPIGRETTSGQLCVDLLS